MATAHQPVSDMVLTVKSREIQRGILAEMREDPASAARHFLAAAHLELVLASDYAEAGQDELAQRSRISAASCLWRGGRTKDAGAEFDALVREFPVLLPIVQQALANLDKPHNGTESTT